MKNILLFTLMLLSPLFALAQCEPDASYEAQGVGVYPLPDPVGADVDTLGITKVGYVNQPYDFTFTAVVPDSLNLLGALADLDSVIIYKIEGMPQGFTYSCGTADCKFLDKTSGCLKIEGTPATTGEYSIKVFAYVYVNGNAAAFLPTATTFPGAIFPGEYILKIQNGTGIEDAAFAAAISLSPNPAADYLTLQSEQLQGATIELMSINGAVLSKEVGQGNSHRLHIAHLPEALYAVKITNAQGKTAIKKFLHHN